MDITALTKQFITNTPDTIADVISFLTEPWGFGLKLLPVQKFIFKLFYGMPLDDGPEKTVPVPDMLNEKILYWFNELEFLRYLQEERLTNVQDLGSKNYFSLVLPVGRRGGKTVFGGGLGGFELYKLIKRGDPAAYYGLVKDQGINVTVVAPSEDQAFLSYDLLKNWIAGSPFFKNRMMNYTQTYFNIKTNKDIESGNPKKASLLVKTGGSSSNSIRGPNNIVLIFDEAAFFLENAGRFSGKELYKALVPSTGTLKGDGKVLVLSSPGSRYGMFFEEYESSFNSPDEVLMVNLPSAVMNPNVDKSVLRMAYRKNRRSFMCEYGGRFSDTVDVWIEDETEFRANISNRQKKNKGEYGVEYFMGIDLATKNDGVAIAVVHKDFTTGKIVLDHSEVAYSGSSDVWEREMERYIRNRKYRNAERIRIEDTTRDIMELVRNWPIRKGFFDQWNGYGLLEMLEMNDLMQFELLAIGNQVKVDMFQTFRTLYQNGMLDMYNDEPLIEELLSLESEKTTKNKEVVQAPRKVGCHDDLSFAFILAVWQCYQFYQEKVRPMKPEGFFNKGAKGGSFLQTKHLGFSKSNFRKMPKGYR